jgi:hypothetical protein
VFFAIAALGFVINSSCAPDHKKTPVGKNGGPGGAGGAGGGDILTNRAVVKSEAGSCPANPDVRDASKLQPSIDKLAQPGTPITFDQLPQGQYRLTKTAANLQFTDSMGNGSANFDVYRASTATIADKQATDTCSDFATTGDAPQGFNDKGQNFPIESYFDIGADKKIGHVDAGNFHFVLSPKAALTDMGVNGITDADMNQLKINQQQQMAANAAAGKQIRNNQAAANNAAPHIPTPVKKFFHKVPADKIVLGNGNGTTTSQLYKISDTEYALGVTFNESANVTRKVLLIYGYVNTAPAAQAGTMQAPSIPNKDAAPIAPAPAEKSPAAPGAPAPAANQQPSGNQQDEDAAAKQKAVDTAAAASASPGAATPQAPVLPPANPAGTLTPQDEE